MEERPQGTPPSSDPDGGDPHPCPEDDEFFGVPDAESQEEAINRFMEGLERQEHLQRLISWAFLTKRIRGLRPALVGLQPS